MVLTLPSYLLLNHRIPLTLSSPQHQGDCFVIQDKKMEELVGLLEIAKEVCPGQGTTLNFWKDQQVWDELIKHVWQNIFNYILTAQKGASLGRLLLALIYTLLGRYPFIIWHRDHNSWERKLGKSLQYGLNQQKSCHRTLSFPTILKKIVPFFTVCVPIRIIFFNFSPTGHCHWLGKQKGISKEHKQK